MSEKERKKPYTPSEFAAALCERGYEISSSTVRRLFDAGELAGFRTPGNQRRIFARELNRFLREKS